MTPMRDILFTHIGDAEKTFSFYTYPKIETRARAYRKFLKICE
jgi:hypothetical protein